MTDDTTHRNALANARSAYLRSAMHQPVNWHEWSDAAFESAIAEDKPILLDIGAVWCHWCHVMDRESYENPEIAAIINEHFIAIKVDRDERLDVDARYQAAVSSISGQGGWPLTAFLTPQGLPYFGGTYFPPNDRHGRPGFPRVLLTMAEAFRSKRADVDESAASVISAIEQNESFSGHAGSPGPELVAKLAASALQQFDARNGGFGSQPKFPHSGAIDLLLDLGGRSGELAEHARHAAFFTLEKMSRGGIYDHLAGGFHRYSVDEHWIVPHFEKMAYDNAGLLLNYVHATQSLPAPESASPARVAHDIIRWIDQWLSDRENGGFYASQDADLSLDDDGDYFTWSLAEAKAILTPEELAIAAPFYDIGEVGDMHHNAAKNVLHINQPLAAIAQSAKVDPERAKTLLNTARHKLYEARLARPTPYIDRTIYTGWNAMLIAAYLQAARVLHLPTARTFALKSLDRVLTAAWNPSEGLAHVVAYGECSTDNSATIPATLEDYVFLANAALNAWEITGELRYYTVAIGLADAAIARFYDRTGGAFFDTDQLAPATDRRGALASRRKPLQDSPTPAGNSVAATLLLRLYALNGRPEYADLTTATIECFAGVVEHLGLYAASYGLALQRMLTPPAQVCVIGDDDAAAHLEAAAVLSRYAVNLSIIRLSPDQLNALPPALAETLPHLPPQPGSFAVLCSGNSCQPPVSSPEELLELLRRSV